MEKIIERFLLPLFIIMSLVYAVHSCGGDATNVSSIEITKAFHHKTDNATHIERANISFYFSKELNIQEIKQPSMIDGKQTQIFFFPAVRLNGTQKDEIIKRINESNLFYTVKIEEVTSPVLGVSVTFAYDPLKSFIAYDMFDSIGLQKGIVFHIYNKDLLHDLKKNSNQPILRTLWYTDKPRIVIDPAHGGTDSGAVGCCGIREKDVCLAIGTTVAQLLRDQGFSVVLTRESDATLQLDDRSTLANKHKADLFVSIHANHAPNANTVGVETFCLQPFLFKQQKMGTLNEEESLFKDYTYHKAHTSYKLACSVQRHVCDAISCYHAVPIDRKVKFSVTQVLLGTQMPSVLVEVGFLSNSKESELLNAEWYQKSVARGIYDGILAVFAC